MKLNYTVDTIELTNTELVAFSFNSVRLFTAKSTDYIQKADTGSNIELFLSNGTTVSFSVNSITAISYGSTTTVYTDLSSATNYGDTTGTARKLDDVYVELTSNVFRGCCRPAGPTVIGGLLVEYADYAAMLASSPGSAGVLYLTQDDNQLYRWDGAAFAKVDGYLKYANFASFPLTGLAGIFYIDESTPELYYWDGAAYQPLSGSGGGGNTDITTITRVALQALIAGTSVSPTTIYRITDAVGSTKVIDVWGLSTSTISGDAINHTDSLFGFYDITGDTFVEQGDGVYVPLSGTAVGSPITGPLEFDSTSSPRLYSDDGTETTEILLSPSGTSTFEQQDNASGDYSRVRFDTHKYIYIESEEAGGALVQIILTHDAPDSVDVLGSSPTFWGINASTWSDSEVESQFGSSVLPTRLLKKRFWTKAGAPTTSDDSTQGFIVGSLLWDTTNSILYRCTDNTVGAAVWTVAISGGGGSGTVTSVALSAPAEFTVSGSPVTTSGTLTLTKANQSANLVYAGPTTGAAAQPTFRALVASDIPTSIRQDQFQILYGASTVTVPASSTRFAALQGRETIATAETGARLPMRGSGEFNGIYLETNGTQPASGSLVVTLRKNAANTALTFTIAAGSGAGIYSDIVNTVTYVDGDQVNFSLVNNATAASAAILNTSASYLKG